MAKKRLEEADIWEERETEEFLKAKPRFRIISIILMVAYLILIPLTCYALFVLLLLIQCKLYEKPGEMLFGYSALMVPSLFFAILGGFILIAGLKAANSSSYYALIRGKAFSPLSQFGKAVTDPRKIHTHNMIYACILLALFIVISFYMMSSYVKITDSNIIISKAGWSPHETIHSFEEMQNSTYAKGCDYQRILKFSEPVSGCLRYKLQSMEEQIEK